MEFAKGLSGLPLIGSYQNGQKMNEMTGMDPETIMVSPMFGTVPLLELKMSGFHFLQDIIQGLSA